MFLSVVIPCYNEASRGSGDTSLESRLERILSHFSQYNYELHFVDDGSTDNSIREILDFISRHEVTNWSVIKSDKNHGKGHAIRTGIDVAVGDYCLIMDADLSTSLSRLDSCLKDLEPNTCIIGTRYADDSIIVNKRKFSRRVISKISRILIQSAFGLGVSDTQCGFKVFPMKALQKSTSYIATGWLYDIELLMCMKYQGVVIKEFPVLWDNMENESTLQPVKAILKSFDDLFDLLFCKSAIKSRYGK